MREILVNQAAIKVFAEAVNDPNPIHQDDAVARQMGLDGAIAHGMYVFSYLTCSLESWIREQGGGWEIRESKCRFHHFVPIGKKYFVRIEVGAGDQSKKMQLSFLNEKEERLTHLVAMIEKI